MLSVADDCLLRRGRIKQTFLSRAKTPIYYAVSMRFDEIKVVQILGSDVSITSMANFSPSRNGNQSGNILEGFGEQSRRKHVRLIANE